MSRRFSEDPGLTAGLAVAAISLLFAFAIFAFLAMGECLARDGSAAMRACDAGRRFEFWAYPLAVALPLLAAMFLRRKWGAWALATMLITPFAALAAVLTVERSIF